MNLVAFGLMVICCHAWATEIDENVLALETYADLRGALEGLKSTIRNGDSSLGIPPLDPYIESELSVSVTETQIIVLTLDALLTNLRVEGLSSFNVNGGEFKPFGLKASVNLDWPMVRADTNYSISKCNFEGTELNGHGNVQAAAHNFRFQTNIKLKLKGFKHVQIKTVSTTISLGALDFNVTGLLDNDEKSKEWSKKISERVLNVINKESKLVNRINQIIMKKGNEVLAKYTIKELEKLGLPDKTGSIHRRPAAKDVPTPSAGRAEGSPASDGRHLATGHTTSSKTSGISLAHWVPRKISSGTDQGTQTEPLSYSLDAVTQTTEHNTLRQETGTQTETPSGFQGRNIDTADQPTEHQEASPPPTTQPKPVTPGRTLRSLPPAHGKPLKRLSRTKRLLLELYGPIFLAEL